MTEKLFGSGRRGGVLLIAGALLGAFIAGPGNSIAQKMGGVVGLSATTADKRYVKRGETLAAGTTDETKLAKFASTTFTPLAQAKVTAPGAGFLYITGNLSAADDTTTAGGSRLQYRLAVNDTPLSTTAESFELFMAEDLDAAAPNPRENGTVTGIIKTTAKGELHDHPAGPGGPGHRAGDPRQLDHLWPQRQCHVRAEGQAAQADQGTEDDKEKEEEAGGRRRRDDAVAQGGFRA